jgi:hypothetical protein
MKEEDRRNKKVEKIKKKEGKRPEKTIVLEIIKGRKFKRNLRETLIRTGGKGERERGK